MVVVELTVEDQALVVDLPVEMNRKLCDSCQWSVDAEATDIA